MSFPELEDEDEDVVVGEPELPDDDEEEDDEELLVVVLSSAAHVEDVCEVPSLPQDHVDPPTHALWPQERVF